MLIMWCLLVPKWEVAIKASYSFDAYTHSQRRIIIFLTELAVPIKKRQELALLCK